MGWEPSARLVCQWLACDTPTELEARFGPGAGGGTVVEAGHRGWERFGQASGGRRDRDDRGWSCVVARYLAVSRTAPPGLSEEAS